MTDIRTRLADTLAEFMPESDGGQDGSLNLRIADALLSLPGIAIIELPELMGDRSHVADSIRNQAMWTTGDSWATLNPDTTVEFESDGQKVYGTLAGPADARTLAAVLLAAANAAEQAAVS